MISGAGRENISVVATCCTDLCALDPPVTFSGINFQSTWHGKNLLRNICYGTSKNGWMATEVFAMWCKNFVKHVKESPLLVNYDGYLPLTSFNLIEKATKEQITIVKLLPVTDKLQLIYTFAVLALLNRSGRNSE